jgi:heat shock protein HslJ
VGEAYSYAYVKVTAGGDEFVLQPIDYVGESLLAPGEYTYVLDVAEQQLLLTLVEGDEALPPTPPEESVAVPPTNTAVSPTGTVAPTEAPVADLNGTSWRLVAYGAPDRAEAVLPGTEITADFLDGQLTGSAGCNQYFTTYEQSGSALTTGAVASTRIGCTPEVNEQELRVLQGLETAVSFEVSNDTLTIQHGNGVLVFAAAAPAQPETAVVDTLESILILSPGPGSAVTSPVVISGEADYVFEASLAVEIRAIEAAEPVGVGFAMLNVSEIGQRGPFSGEVAFTAPAEATPGRISIFTISARDGHIEHLASVPVTLLPVGGAANITTAEPHPEAIAIHTPEHLARLTGGSAHVTGYAAPTFEQNLVIEVLDGEGMVVGQGATIIASDMGQWGPFAADVSYSVAAETPGALCVTDYSPADGNMVHRTCLNVTLAP